MNGTHPHGALRSALLGLLVLLLTLGALPTALAQSLPQAPDPATPGPYAVTREDYSFGAAALPGTFFAGYTPTFPGPVELNGSVTYPSTAAGSAAVATDASGNPIKFPLIMFLHGRHSTAYDPSTGRAFLEWPPKTGHLSIPSYKGYDYISQVLASYGYVVVSIGANGVNAVDNMTTDRGMLARAELMQKQLDLWRDLGTTGDTTRDVAATNAFGVKFAGRIDMTRIGTMGHSRGGEGVMAHASYNNNPALNPEAAGGPAYPLKAVLPLAPVDFNRYIVNNIPIAVILPYCDGDVSDLQGIHFYDDARYSVPADTTAKYFWTIMGADHNFSNTIWTPGLFPTVGATYGFGGTGDDWLNTRYAPADPFAGPTRPGNHRLSPADQETVVRNYMLAFFRTYVGGETQFLPFLRGDAAPPPSSPTSELFETYQTPPATPGGQTRTRLDVNAFLTPASLTVNAAGGAVTEGGLSPFGVAGGNDPVPATRPLPGQPGSRQPSNTPSAVVTSVPGLSQLRLGWSAPGAFLEDDLPSGQGDVSAYQYLQFRAAVNFTDYRNTTAQDDFDVVLTDAAGHSAAVPVSAYTRALAFPPGRIGPLPKVVLNAVRIPLADFGGVDPTRIVSVKLVFDRTPKGAILLTDLAFAGTPSGAAL